MRHMARMTRIAHPFQLAGAERRAYVALDHCLVYSRMRVQPPSVLSAPRPAMAGALCSQPLRIHSVSFSLKRSPRIMGVYQYA